MLRRSGIKAIESIRVDMNILKLHCGNRVRDAVFRKIAEISKDSNIEMFQKEVILKLKTGVRFLQRHLPQHRLHLQMPPVRRTVSCSVDLIRGSCP